MSNPGAHCFIRPNNLGHQHLRWEQPFKNHLATAINPTNTPRNFGVFKNTNACKLYCISTNSQSNSGTYVFYFYNTNKKPHIKTYHQY